MKSKFEKLFNDYEKLINKSEKSIIVDFRDSLEAAYSILGEQFRKYEYDGALTYAEMIKYKRLDKLYHELEIIVNEGYKKSYKSIQKALGDTYLSSYNGTKDIVELSLKKELIPIVKDEVIQKAITNNISGLKWTERMNLHRDTAVMRIRETVAQGLHQGETYSTMAKRLNESLSNQVVNPMRIIRTESHRVFSEARKDSLDKVSDKVAMTKVWITSKDERVRGRNAKDTMDHVSMHDVKVPYDENFKLPDGSEGFAPGQIGDYNDINCRCDWIIEFVEDNLGGLSSGEDLSEADEPIFVEKLHKVDYNIAKDKLTDYDKEIIDKDFENAYVITKDGEVYRFEGKQATVNPEKLGDKLKDSYITHNHPANETEYTFSQADLNFFKEYQLSYLRGIDEKYTYELSKGLFEMEELRDYPITEMPDDYVYHYRTYLKAKEDGLSYRRSINE